MSFTFKKTADQVYSTEPEYDLLYGGYIDPDKLLAMGSEAEEVNRAIMTIIQFLEEAQEANLLEIG